MLRAAPAQSRLPSRFAVAADGLPRRSALLALIAIQLALFYLLLAGGSWVYDDNLIMVLAGHSGLTWTWLTSTIFQHWGIGYHFVFSALHKLMPIDYRWALVGMLALLGASAYLLERIASMLFGGRWRGLAAAAFLGFSVLFVRQFQWPASGLQALPDTFCDLLCLYAYLRFVRDGTGRWVVVSAGALAAGFLFYEKPAYMLLYLPLIRVLMMAEDLHPRKVAQVFWRERAIWAALLGVAAVWAIGYLHYGGGNGLGAGKVTIGQYLRFFRIMWAQTLVPAWADVTLPQAGLDTIQVTGAIVLQLGFVAAVVVSWRRNQGAWRAWLLLGISALVNGILVARARVPLFGSGVAGDLRYWTDFAWLAPLTACFAFGRRSTVWPRQGEPAVRLRLPGSHRVGAAIAAAALLAYFGAGIATTAKLRREWPGEASRAWQAHLRAGLGRLQAGGRRVVVADAPSPFFIVPPAFPPYNRLSWIVPLYDPRAQVDGVLDGPLVIVDASGAVHRAVVASSLGGGLVRARPMCVAAASRRAAITRLLPRGPASSIQPHYLRVTYSARQAQVAPVFVDSGSGMPWRLQGFVELARRPATSILYLPSGPPRRVRLLLAPGTSVCISRLDVVTLRAVS